MPVNLSDAEPQKDFGAPIPDGTFCKVKLAIKPGGYTMPGEDPADNGLFRQAKPPSDAVMLDCELTVLPPSPHAKRKIFQMWMISGGKVDENGRSIAWNITKSALLAMVESALGIDPSDKSPAADARRQLPDFRTFNGIEFYARISVESDPVGHYADQNRIGHVVVPSEPEYAELVAGKIPEPRPSRGGGGRRAATAGAGVASAKALHAWQRSTPAVSPASAPAAAAPAPGWKLATPAVSPASAPATAAPTAPNWLRE